MKPLTGIVTSAKMVKTVAVEVKRQTAHPLYHKRIWFKKKYHAHNELEVKEGDRVKIAESRPLSKTKKWRVIKVLDQKSKTKSKKTKK